MKRALCLLLLCACPEKKVEAPAPPPPPPAPVARANVVPEPQPEAPAEVEFMGNVSKGKVAAARLVFVVARGPCTADSTELDVIEQTDVSEGKLFSEMFFPQGTVAHLCLVALDAKGQQVGHAGYPKNPVTLQGQGEVMVTDLELSLAPVKARPAPKGL
jgi:hypothetical protein